MAGNLILVILLLSLVAYFVGQAQGRKFVYATSVGEVHSRPIYHGAFVAVWVGVPALLLVLAWLMFQGTGSAVLGS
jgi:phosphate transport system permease protein